MKNLFDIKSTIEIFEIVEKQKEVCYIKKNGGGRIRINFKDEEELINKIQVIDTDSNTQGVYFLANPTKNETTASKAEDVLCREWLIIDIDNEYRAKNESLDVTILHQFKDNYLELLEEVIDFSQLPCRIFCSGNGYHVGICCDLDLDEKTEKAVKNFYNTLAKVELPAGWKIDTSMAKCSQLTKFYGTCTRKGEIRFSYHCYEYNIFGDKLNYDKLIEITKEMEDKIKIQKNRKFLEELLETYLPETAVAWGKNYVQFEHCPMCDEHTSSWSATIYYDNGFRFQCFGDHCKQENGEQKHNFADFYKKVTGHQWQGEKKKKKSVGRNLSQIEAEGEFVGYATGIAQLDEQLGGGLKQRTYSVITGLPSGGKSTLCFQIVNNLLEQGYTVGYYQSDGTLEGAKANLIKQSGMSEEAYNQKYENNLTLFDDEDFSCDTLSTAGDFDVFFIDHMAGLLPQKSDYDFQKSIVKQVKKIARDNYNHIVWVCHQRKHNEFDSTDKIEGTSDISRFAWTVLDLEKCNQRYWEKVRTTKGRQCDEIHQFAKSVSQKTPIRGIINIFKNQQTGQEDPIPLCFSQEEKTFTPYIE